MGISELEGLLEKFDQGKEGSQLRVYDTWLSEMGYLTETYLKASLKLIRLIDKSIKSTEVEYNKNDNTLKLIVYLSWWGYYFKKKKVYDKLLIFSENNYVDQDVDVMFKLRERVVKYV